MRFKKIKSKILAFGLMSASISAPLVAPLAQPATAIAAETDANVKTGWYEIKAASNTSKNLDVAGKTAANGANVCLWGDYNMSNQRFYIKNLGKGIYKIWTGTGNHKLALDVVNGAKKGNVRQWTDNNSNAQRWRIVKNSDGSVSFQNVSSGHYLDLVDGKTKDGTNVRVWERNSSSAQKFKLEYICAAGKLPTNPTNINGWYRISPSYNTKFSLDVNGNNYNAGTNITLWQNNDSDAQKFYIKHIGNGEYIINTGASHQMGNIDINNTARFGNVKQWNTTNSSAQKFRIYKYSDGSYGFYNNATGQWLDIAGNGAYKNGTNVQVYNYLGKNGITTAEGQGFKLSSVKSSGTYTTVKNGWYEIHPKTNGNALLDVVSGKTANGTNIQIYQKHEKGTPDAQKFYFQQVSGYDYIIYTGTENRKKALDVSNSKSNGNVTQWQAHKGANQIWRIVKNTDGYYTFINKATKQALDMVNGKTSNGTNVRVWQTNGADAQRWSINGASLPNSAKNTTTTTSSKPATTTNTSKQAFSNADNTDRTVGAYVNNGGYSIQHIDKNGLYYTRVTGSEPQCTITGGAYNAHQMAKNVGAKAAIDAGMVFGNGNYYSYGKMWTNYWGNNEGNTLVLRTNGYLDSCHVNSSNASSLGLRWAVKGLITLTYNGVNPGYINSDGVSSCWSFIAQDYNGAYYIGSTPNNMTKLTLRSKIHASIPNVRFAYATEGGGHVKYIRNGNLVVNGHGESGRTTPGLIWFK